MRKFDQNFALAAYWISYVLWAVWCLPEGRFLPVGIASAVIECLVVKPLIWLGPSVPLLLKRDGNWQIPFALMLKKSFPWFPTLVSLCLTAVFLHTVHIFTVGIATWGIFAPVQVLFSLSAAVVEEVVFRGVLFNRQAPVLGVWQAAALNGVLFALYHYPEFVIGRNLAALTGFRFWMITVVGCLFCLAFARWKRLGMTITIHFFWNILSYYFGMA